VQGQAKSIDFQQALLRAQLGRSHEAERRDGALLGNGPANLDANGRPAFDTTRNGGGTNATLCDCQFTDWDQDTNGDTCLATPKQPTANQWLTYTAGASGHPMYKGPAPIVTSADTFAQWWVDSKYTNNTHIVSTLELGPVAGATNLYRFSSPPHSVYGNFFPLDPPANNFPIYSLTGSTAGPGTVTTSTTGNNEPLLCTYGHTGIVRLNSGPGLAAKEISTFSHPASRLVPIRLRGSGRTEWRLVHAGSGWFHDFWFSTEARYLFTFNGAFQLQFFGDDDTFVFINGVLVNRPRWTPSTPSGQREY